jgi:hypothetical protein
LARIIDQREIICLISRLIFCQKVSMEPIRMFFYKWPRNFAISFAVEACIAQPIARIVMLRMHEVKDKKIN